MSEKAYCPSGGMDGILVSGKELKKFSDAIGSDFADEVIPLPNLTTEQQKAILSVCRKHNDNEYWERDNGKHGWCCSKCGTVTQWG